MSQEHGRGAAGGRANEGGSVHRAGVAAYLAAHALTGLSVSLGHERSPGPPEFLWLESSGAIDDLWCGFGRARWEVQAKRRCNWDTVCFSKVVAQWVSAVRSGEYGENDKLVLAAGRVSGPLRILGDALRRRRRNSDAELLPNEKKALDRLRRHAVSTGWLDILEEVTASAMVVELEVESVAHSAFREAARALDGVVVERGSGLAAMNALARFFHTEGARSGASGADDWLRVLDQAGVRPGPSSTQTLAGDARAMATYRRGLARRKDMLDVDLLGGGVPPMRVPELLDTFEVALPAPADESWSNTPDLADLARRWRRFGIVGLPGSGKTTALEQLAAAWADDADAPVPVLVRLHKVLPMLRDRRPLEVEDWCGLGDAVTLDLVPILADRVRRGGGALFLDGLDECRDQQGRAASAIRDLADELNADTGLIFSVREVSSGVARSTQLPLTTLREPSHLEYLIGDLVEHVAKNDVAATADLPALREWFDESQNLHPDIWAVPLFAVLLAVHAARTPSPDLPTTRAEALVAAVKDSVRRWEREKTYDPAAWDRDLEPGMLLQGFTVIGHELMLGQRSVSQCARAVATALAEPWGLAPARSGDIALDILVWWSERVGAFVVEAGELQSRLRMFSEVGDAMWAARESSEGRTEWLHRVLQHPGKYREPALLAAALDPSCANELVTAATSPESVLLAADAVLQGSRPSHEAVAKLLTCLGDFLKTPPAPRERERDKKVPLKERVADARTQADGSGWRFGYRLAALPLPPGLRRKRDECLGHVDGIERRAVAAALAAAADCGFDGRDPDEKERRALHSVLELPIPVKERPPPRRSRRDPIELSSGPRVARGRAEAVIAAIRLVGLTRETAEGAAELSQRVWVGISERLRAAIRAAGFADELVQASETLGLGRTYAELLGPDPYLHMRLILSAVANLTDGPAVWWEPWRLWRLDSVGSLFEVLDEGPHPLGAGQAAARNDPELVRHLAVMAAGAVGLPLRVVAAECRRALEMLEDDALGTFVLLHTRPDPSRSTKPGAPAIRAEDVPVLASCLRRRNPWLFWPAAVWLDRAKRPDLLDIFLDALPDMWGEHRYVVATWLPEATGRRDIHEKWIHEDDPVLRVVASRELAKAATDVSVILPLLRHTDLLVRLEALRGLSDRRPELVPEAARIAVSETPSVWTCLDCGSLEAMATFDCTNCSRGARRALEEEVGRLIETLGDSSAPRVIEQ
ncbi:MAG: hypothetical protein M3285_02765 [Actinomycetota bacterium]|nr:hypothetical protein [Actinomycetota bacterium]MDQ3954453.1 hypothetical protein [Actinomycetota bacterium]